MCSLYFSLMPARLPEGQRGNSPRTSYQPYLRECRAMEKKGRKMKMKERDPK